MAQPSPETSPVVPEEASLSQRLLDALRSDVISGRYSPGYRLVERDVAETYGVSRLPAREALRTLQAEGFLEARKTRGLVVRSWTRRDVVELFDIRQALETMACREAAQNRTDGDLDSLHRALTAADEAAAAGDTAAAHDANGDFHTQLVTASHNRTLYEVMSPILFRVQWLVRQIPDPRTAFDDHHAIVEAIKRRDGEQAATLAHQHAEHHRIATVKAMFP